MQGRLFATDVPGLGVTPDLESLGKPVAVYTAASLGTDKLVKVNSRP